MGGGSTSRTLGPQADARVPDADPRSTYDSRVGNLYEAATRGSEDGWWSYLLKGRTQSDLRKADFSNSDLLKALFYEADLSGSNLAHTNLDRAGLSGARLIGTNLVGASGIKTIVADWIEVQHGDAVIRLEGDAVRKWLETACVG